MQVFNPPVAQGQQVLGTHRLWQFFPVAVGVTVLKNGSTYTRVQCPTDVQLAAADKAYRGGYVHVLTAQEVTDLTAAGYGSYISTV